MDDSSPDLSLKLRRGSSDSRDSFYMDFAQGIDSDIEEVTTDTAATASERLVHQVIAEEAELQHQHVHRHVPPPGAPHHPPPPPPHG